MGLNLDKETRGRGDKGRESCFIPQPYFEL